MTADGWTIAVCVAVIAVALPVAVWDWRRAPYRAVVEAAQHLTRTAAKEHTS